MPRFNLDRENLGTATPRPARGNVPLGSGTEIAQAVGNLAGVVEQVNYNRSLVASAQASTEAAQRIDELESSYKTDDKEYSTQKQRFDEFVGGLKEEYGERFKNNSIALRDFNANLDKYANKKGLDIQERALLRDMDEQKAILGDTLLNINGIATRGDQEQFDESVASGNQLIDSAVENGILTPGEAAEEKRNFERGLSRGLVRKDITDDPQRALDKIRAGEYSGLSAEEQSQFEASALSKLSQNQNAARHTADKQAQELVKDTILSYENGYPVGEEEYKAAQLAAGAIGQERLEDLEVARAASQYIRLPKKDRDGLPEQLTGVNNAEARLALEKADEIIETELNKDAYAFAVRQGIVEEIPLDINDPSTVQARLEQVDYLKSHYGRSISPLTDEEATRLTNALPQLTPDLKTGLALAFGTSEAIWQQLDKKNAGTFALAGAVGDEQIIRGIFKGQQLLADNLVKLPENNEDLLAAFDDLVGDIYVGKDRKNMLDASIAYYASIQGKGGGFFGGGSDFEDAIQAVAGGITSVNGSKVELPRGVLEETFEDYIDDFTPEAIAEFGGVWSMNDKQAAKTLQRAKIKSVGSNRYVAVVDDAVLMAADGSGEFVFSFDESLAQKAQKSAYDQSISGRIDNAVRAHRAKYLEGDNANN